MNDSIKILLVEDDTDLGRMLKLYLDMDSFRVEWCETGEDSLQKMKEMQFDIAVLDINLPGISGLEVAEKMIRSGNRMPFLFLTARKLKTDKLAGLKLGADDYICKPFDAEELVLRIKNILNRLGKSGDQELKIGEYVLQYNDFKLLHHKNVQQLTEREAQLLKYLILHRNQLVKSSDILTNLWGEDDYFLGRSMNVFMTRLRKYLRFDPSIEIVNVRGVGYELRCRE